MAGRAIKCGLATIAVWVLLLLAKPASAHRIDEFLQATVLTLQPSRVQASMRLVPGILVAPSIIAGIDSNSDGAFSQQEEQVYAQQVLNDLSITLNGQNLPPQLVSFSFPQPAELRNGLGEIHIEYTAALPSGGTDQTLTITNRHQRQASVYLVNVLVPDDPALRIITQKRNQQQSIYQLEYQQQAINTTPQNASATLAVLLGGVQLSSLFHLGMRHIAEGTDHLLFLFTLLLPAPLLVSGIAPHKQWGPPAGIRRSLLHILGIVTAFTLGHSITLALAALGAVHVPARPIEILIAVSILVSALHALRPIVPGKESLVAVFFGLIHGLAFAATLSRLGLGPGERIAGILAFNLGIEAMQMLVVSAILPSLLLLSTTRAYPVFRIAGALFALAASLAWLVERLSNLQTPVDRIVNAMAHHAPGIAITLFVISLVYKLLSTPRSGRKAENATVATT